MSPQRAHPRAPAAGPALCRRDSSSRRADASVSEGKACDSSSPSPEPPLQASRNKAPTGPCVPPLDQASGFDPAVQQWAPRQLKRWELLLGKKEERSPLYPAEASALLYKHRWAAQSHLGPNKRLHCSLTLAAASHFSSMGLNCLPAALRPPQPAKVLEDTGNPSNKSHITAIY